MMPQEVGRSLATAAPFGDLLGYSLFTDEGVEYYMARYMHFLLICNAASAEIYE